MAECGTCKQCCITYPLLPNADYWPEGKPTHTPCKHVCEKGCAIHDQPRPNVCTSFRCLWLKFPKIGDQMPRQVRPTDDLYDTAQCCQDHSGRIQHR